MESLGQLAKMILIPCKNIFLASRGRLGAVKGKEGAIMDFFVFFLNVDELIERDYEKRISPEFRRV